MVRNIEEDARLAAHKKKGTKRVPKHSAIVTTLKYPTFNLVCCIRYCSTPIGGDGKRLKQCQSWESREEIIWASTCMKQRLSAMSTVRVVPVYSRQWQAFHRNQIKFISVTQKLLIHDGIFEGSRVVTFLKISADFPNFLSAITLRPWKNRYIISLSALGTVGGTKERTDHLC